MQSKSLYLIQPLEHGNGGCYGIDVLAYDSPENFMSCHPVEKYLNGFYEPEFGHKLRLCSTKDMNDVVYFYDHEEWKWLDKEGKSLF